MSATLAGIAEAAGVSPSAAGDFLAGGELMMREGRTPAEAVTAWHAHSERMQDVMLTNLLYGTPGGGGAWHDHHIVGAMVEAIAATTYDEFRGAA